VDLQLAGKRALVTGSSSGIGEAIAKALAAEGAKVVVQGRREAEAKRVAAEIKAAGGQVAVAIGDLATDAGADAVAKAATAAFGGIDILVNNAGAFPMFGWFDESAAAWNDLYNQNVGSMVRMIQRLVPAMKGLKWGRVIQIASGAGPEPVPEMPAYCVTKAANINMTVSLSKALAGTGITVNTVSPGPIVTGGFKEMFTKAAAAQGQPTDWPSVEKMALSVFPVPIGRLGLPDDVAHAVTYLASPRADFITGANLRVDGGILKSSN
jgi:3-oxoacyl-[acyl-carrier protein] reductase